MKLEQQVPRNALVWIIISLFTLVAPHVQRIPLWVLGVYVLAAGWRIMVYRGRWSFPGRWVKLVLTISSFAGVVLSYGTVLGLEPTVALLLTAFALKLIELAERKDAYVLLFLGYFICITEFLFSQDLPIVLYSLLNILLVTTALVALHQPGEHAFNRRTFRHASVMILQALPLMLVLFLLFPRLGPLWSVPMMSHSAKTGVSDYMKPGDIANLSQSDEVAFRVQFEGEIPDRADLYWRGLVFSSLEDGAWRSIPHYLVPVSQRRPDPVATQGEPLRYSIIMEPTQQQWLYSLRYARANSNKVIETSDYRLTSPVELEGEYQYSVSTWTDAVLEQELSPWRQSTELRLPANDNPRTAAFAKQLYQSMNSDAEFVAAVLKRFNTEPYVYTLQPPLLDDDPMDQFLFETRRGFCEHYAYAFVVMMRAAGVPSRVVAGYLGGEVNPINKTVIVHQFDAHAWAEVWLAGRGWVRVDPTAQVAPDRIEWGLERAMAQEGSFLSGLPLSPMHFRDIQWLNRLRLQYDALTWRWQKFVIGFDTQRQYSFLQDLFGEINVRTFVLVLIGSWVLVLIPVALSLFLKRKTHPVSVLDKWYLRFCARIANAGVQRDIGETPAEFGARAANALPDRAQQIETITAMYDQLAYTAGSDEQRTAQVKAFTRAVRAL